MRVFLNALTQTKTWKIVGQQLVLLDTDGQQLACLEALYLKLTGQAGAVYVRCVFLRRTPTRAVEPTQDE